MIHFFLLVLKLFLFFFQRFTLNFKLLFFLFFLIHINLSSIFYSFVINSVINSLVVFLKLFRFLFSVFELRNRQVITLTFFFSTLNIKAMFLHVQRQFILNCNQFLLCHHSLTRELHVIIKRHDTHVHMWCFFVHVNLSISDIFFAKFISKEVFRHFKISLNFIIFHTFKKSSTRRHEPLVNNYSIFSYSALS